MPAILPSPEAEAAWLRPDLERRGRGGDVRAARRAAGWTSAPANPKLNKVGKGMEEGPELLVAP